MPSGTQDVNRILLRHLQATGEFLFSGVNIMLFIGAELAVDIKRKEARTAPVRAPYELISALFTRPRLSTPFGHTCNHKTLGLRTSSYRKLQKP